MKYRYNAVAGENKILALKNDIEQRDKSKL